MCVGGVLSCEDPEGGGGMWKIISYMGFYRN